MAYGSTKSISDSILSATDGESIQEEIDVYMQSTASGTTGDGLIAAATINKNTDAAVTAMRRKSLGARKSQATAQETVRRDKLASVGRDWTALLMGVEEEDAPINATLRSDMMAKEASSAPQTANEAYLQRRELPTDGDRPDVLTPDGSDNISGSGASEAEGRFDDEPATTTSLMSRPAFENVDAIEAYKAETMTSTGLSDDDMGLPDYERSAFMAPNSLFRTALKEKEAGSYSTLFGDAEKSNTPFKGVDITTMPMSEVLDLVKFDGDFHKYNKARKKPQNTTAIGKYQFVGATLRDLKKRGVFKKLGITDDTLFDESTQDALSEYQAIHRIRDRGNGTMAGARKEMRNEWEGFKKLSDSRLDSIINEIASEIGVSIGGTKLSPRESLRPKERFTSLRPKARPAGIGN